MKRLISIILAIISILPNSSKTECCKDCIKTIKQSAYGHVTTLTNPEHQKNITGFCGKIFEREGHCCEPGELWEYAQKWLGTMKHQINRTRFMIEQFKGSVQFIEILKKFIKKNDKKLKKAKFWKKGEYKDFKQQLDDYTDGIFDFNFLEKKLKGSIEDCYSVVFTLRSNGLCMRCSGSASGFWDKKKKFYKVKKDNCKVLIEQCYSVFSYMVEINTYYKRLALLKKFAKGKVENEKKVRGFMHKDLNKFRRCGINPKNCDVLEMCKHFSLHDTNPDLEGDVFILKAGIDAQLKIVKGISPKRRVLTEMTNLRSKLEAYMGEHGEREREIMRNAEIRNLRLLAPKSSSSSSAEKKRKIEEQ